MKLCTILMVAAVGATGCGSEGTANDSPDDGGGATTEEGGPILLAFGTNTTTLRNAATDRLVVSAVLTDPDGVDDIIGGSLREDATNATLGTFSTAAQEGAYMIELDWTRLLAPVAANLPGWGEVFALTVRAEFFDQAGHKATQTASVSFVCPSDDLLVQRVGATACEVGARCHDGASGLQCEIYGEEATGTEMCQRTAGTACRECWLQVGYDWTCDEPSPDESAWDLECICQ